MGSRRRKPRPPIAAETESAVPDEAVPDETEAEVEALACALRSAPGNWLRQDTLQRLITDTTRYVDVYSRALHLIERRAVSLHTAAGPLRPTGPLQPIPDPARLDPWSCNPAEIENASRVLSVCPTCRGATTVVCRTCSGSARVSCRNCWGSGRVRGKRNMKNCPVCRGRGKNPCGDCSGGQVPCAPCNASGRVWAWLSISQTRMPQVRVHPMGAAALVHKRLKSPEDFDAGSDAWINKLTSDTGDQEPGEELPEGLEPDLNPMSDRVLSTRVQSFSSVVHRFKYEASRTAGYIEVAGSPPMVSGSSNWRPLRIRQALAAAIAVCFGVAALGLMGSYLGRHAWYATYGYGGLVALTWALLGVALAFMVAGLLLPRRLWSRARVWVPLGVAGIAAAGFGVAWKVPGPSAAAARKALADKNFTRAEVEANALRELNIDATAAAGLLDDLHIERLKSATTVDQLASIVAEPWSSEERRKVGLDALRDIAEKKRDELYSAKNLEGLVSLSKSVGDLDKPLRDNVDAYAMLLRAEACVSDNDCSCVANSLKAAAAVDAVKSDSTRVHDQAIPAFAAALKEMVKSASPATTKDPHQRQTVLRQALNLAKCYGDFSGKPSEPEPPVLEAQLAQADREVDAADKKAAALAAAEEAKRKQAEAIEEAKRKQAAAAAAAQQAAEERASRAASRNLVCGDGSISGCPCAGSHRGCCSHHGGVAGCE